MVPPQPQLSLPTPQNVTRHGSARPLLRRSSAIGLEPSKVSYSTHCCLPCMPSLPADNRYQRREDEIDPVVRPLRCQ